jgi:tRNA threonylcarbamoyladenosine biosynthesis protein TsaE
VDAAGHVAVAVADGRRVGAETLAPVRHVDLGELDSCAAALAARVTPPALITLTGDVGAGKTTFVQALCRSLGVVEPVTSPTFALVHEYAARDGWRIVHCDLYRLTSDAQVRELGLDDARTDPQTLVVVEWPERAGGALGEATVAIELAHDRARPDTRLLRERWAR